VITIGAENFRINSTDGSIYQSKVANAILKSVSGVITAAVANTDYQAPITLTTTGSSGPATLSGSTLNIPDYSTNTTNFVTISGTQTITGTKTFNEAIRNESGLLLKNGVISGLAGYTSLGGSVSNGLVVQLSGSANQQTLSFQTGGAYSYTFPASTGTLALTSDLSSYVPTSRTLTINGETYDLSANRTWTISGITGSGAVGRVAYWNGTSSVTSEAAFNYDDNLNRLGVNTNSPNATIGSNANTDSGFSLLLKNSDTNYSGIGFATDSTYGNMIETVRIGTAPSRNLTLYNYAGFISLTEAGNLGVGILTPNTGIDIYHSTISSLWLHTASSGTSGTDGVRLFLNGSNNNAVLRNNEGSLSMSSESDFFVITLGAENIRVNSANGYVGIGNPTTLTSLLTVNGAITQTSVTSALLKTNASGTIVAAVAGTDYLAGSVISGTTDYIPRFTSSTTIGNSDISQDATFVILNSKALSATRARFNTAYDNASLTLNVAGQTYMDSRTSRLYNTFNLSSMTNYMHIYDPYSSVNANGGFSIGASTSITLLPSTSIIHFDGVNNRVGVGTTAPTRTFSVTGTSYFNGTFTLAAGAGFMYDSLRFAYSNGTSVNYIYSGGSDGLYIANQADTEILMRVTNNGNVGIGTINPDVTGFGWNTLTIRGGTAAGEAGVLELQTVTTNTNGQNVGIMAFMDGSSRNAQISVQRATSTSTANMMFYTNAGAGIVERMRIGSDGTKYFGNYTGSRFQMNAAGENFYQYTNSYYIWGLYNDSNNLSIESAFSGSIIFRAQAQTTSSSPTTATERMRITSAGNVAIGLTNDTYRLTVANNGGSSYIGSSNQAGGTGDRFIRMGFGTGATFAQIQGTRLNVADDVPIALQPGGGTVFIGRTSVFSTFGDSNGIVQYGEGTIYCAASNNESLGLSRIGTDGFVAIFRRSTTTVGSISVNGSATAFNTSSDYRLKEDLKQYNGLDLVSKIKTYDFAWKNDKSRNYGVIAHEVADVIPYVVIGEKDAINEDGTILPQGVDYSKIVPILVKAIQELQQQINELENK
jgi:hypothetical protein